MYSLLPINNFYFYRAIYYYDIWFIPLENSKSNPTPMQLCSILYIINFSYVLQLKKMRYDDTTT